MGLILPQKIQVKLINSNYKHYKDKGYDVVNVKYNTKIYVNVLDLPKYSIMKVLVKCDHCGKIYNKLYKEYIRNNHDGFIYCGDCSRKYIIEHKKTTRKDIELYRGGFEYRQFIMQVLKRDNYTCQCCKNNKKILHVHHLNGYSWDIDNRTNPDNAITLCDECHFKFHSKYKFGNNTKEQYEEWIGDIIIPYKEKYGEIPTSHKIICLESGNIYNDVHSLLEEIGNGNRSNLYSRLNRSNVKYTYKNQIKYTNIKSVKDKHYLWLDEYTIMSKEDINNFLKWTKNRVYNKSSKETKKVICLTTGEIFNSVKDAEIYFNIKKSKIYECCDKTNSKYNSSGKLKDGTKLKWEYYKDYLGSVDS